MLYLSGVLCKPLLEARRPDVGFITTQRIKNRVPEWIMAAYDNDRFIAENWREDVWMNWLAKQRLGMFAVVPDVYRDARATREWFERYAGFVRSTGQPLAYVAQNGSDRYPPPWDDFDVLFVGGDNSFKLAESTWRMCEVARHEYGKWVHVGRVNSLRRLRACRVSSVNSADGTFLGGGKHGGPNVNWPKLSRWLDQINNQEVMLSHTAGVVDEHSGAN